MDIEEFNIKVLTLKDKIFRFARRILENVEDAEDVTQDIFIRMWGMRKKLDKIENIEAMAIRSTKNLCFDRLKHEKVKRNHLESIKIRQNRISKIRTDEDEIRGIIENVVNSLPEKQRMVMHLRDIEGYGIKEIEEMLGMDANAIRVNLSRSRKKVKEEVSKIMSYGL